MGYTVKLFDENEKLIELNCSTVDCGYNIEVGGNIFLAETTITYNYREYFHQVLGNKGLYSLYGKKAKDCIQDLTFAVNILGSEKEGKDIWEATSGNAGYSLNQLLQWAKECPDGIFKVY